jgi:beta-N-acetylhexosaminidase
VTQELDLGLRFIVEPSGTSLTANEAAALRDLKPSGLMLRKRNFAQSAPYHEWLDQYSRLLQEAREAIGRPNIIVSIDHEGGNVHRFPPPITRFPYPALYGRNLKAVEQVAAMMAAELRASGVNLSFSPCADIHSNPQNPVINQRAFGQSSQDVAESVCVFADALRRGGVVPCAKHFPGHGDTSADSHYALPVVAKTLSELKVQEFLPFNALIASGIEMIMSAHLMVPAIDPNNQATLSPAIMGQILRQELSFTGITIADALGMKAIHESLSSGSFAERAHAAGIDLFLMVGDTVSIKDALTIREEWERSASLSMERDSLGEVQARLEAFLSSLPQYSVMELDQKTLNAHQALAAELATNSAWSTFDFNPVGFD